MIIVLKITLCTSILSLLSTIMAILIGITQKAWRKRDGVLFFNIFAVDVLFSCTTLSLCIRLLIMKGGGVTIANVFVFTYLLSWVGQCIITINRYIMVSYPFGYKTMLPRCRFCVMIAIAAIVTYVAMFTSIGINSGRIDTCRLRGKISNCGIIICDVILPQFSRPFLSVVIVLHFILLLAVYIIECWLWRTARRHRHRFHSLTSSINGISKKGCDAKDDRKRSEDMRKGSITQTIMKKISLTQQRPPVQVHGTPIFYLAAHLLTLLSYMTLGVIYTVLSNDLSSYGSYSNVCMAVQLLMSLRPLINVGNHLSTKSLKRFTKLIQKVIQRDSRELFTEYYYENDEEVKTKMLKRKEEIRLRPRT